MPDARPLTEAGPVPPRRRPRGSLTAAAIVTAAERVAERDGLDGLTMPAVARQVGAATTSVYWHFRTRDDLLVALTEAITEQVYGRVPAPELARPWQEAAFDYFTALRRELSRHPTYLTLFSTRARFLFSRADLRGSLLTRLDQGVQLFAQSGATPADAARAFMTCDAFVRGFCILETGLLQERVPEGLDVGDVVADLDAAQFPALSKLQDFERVMWLDEGKFELGLRSLLQGMSGAPVGTRRRRRA